MSSVELSPVGPRTATGPSASLDTTSIGTASFDTVVSVVAERSKAVDAGDTDVRPALRELGAAGLLALGAAGQGGTLTEQADVIRTLARSCMSTAFSTWAQRMAIGYLAAWGTEELRTTLLPELVAGRRAGATAMATAFQDALGLREVAVTAREHAGEVILDGVIPWASNLFADGSVVVLPARTDDGRRLIVAITTDLDGVELPAHPPLLALGTTGSTSVKLDGVTIPGAWVLTERFLDFLADVRPSFLLLQTAFCLGIADAALDGAAGRFAGPATVLEADHDALVSRRDDLAVEHARLLARHGPADEHTVRLRLHAGQLGVDATRHEAGVRGGAGYLATSPVARRLREAAFLPIQSPTEAQLRWELSRSA